MDYRRDSPPLGIGTAPSMCHVFSGIPASAYEGETRSVRLSGHSTSIRLEALFWRTLEELALDQGLSLPKFLSQLHDEVLELNGEVRNFDSLLRCACLIHLERRAGAAAEGPLHRPLPARRPSLAARLGLRVAN